MWYGVSAPKKSSTSPPTLTVNDDRLKCFENKIFNDSPFASRGWNISVKIVTTRDKDTLKMARPTTVMLIAYFIGVYAVRTESLCSFHSCPEIKEDRINVHIVPFSVEELYLDYDSVIVALKENGERRFTFNEVSCFWDWWLKQTNKTRYTVTDLVNKGQIEFAGGGWTINDEAVTNYNSIIDQMTWGLRKLNDTFGVCGRPKVGWQYGQFGHSKEMANIFNELGYDGVIIGHIDPDEKQKRLKNRTLELIWQGSSTLGSSSDIFYSIVYEDWNGFKSILNNNVEKFLHKVQKAAQHYTTRNILVPIGTDQDTNPSSIFKQIDSVYSYLKQTPEAESNFNIIYSTPACYLRAVHKDNHGVVKGPVKEDDFIHYRNDSEHYFNGYYTSNPNLKRFARLSNNFLQICKQLGALIPLKNTDKIDKLREALGAVQRQDGITGAGCKEMQDEYPRDLYDGVENCFDVIQEALKILTHDENIEYQECTFRLNITECELSEKSDNFVVTAYNPLSKKRTKYVRLPVSGNAYRVRGSDGVDLPTQIAPVPFPDIPGRKGKTHKKLLFPATDIPPMGFKTFYVERIDELGDNVKPYEESNDVTEFYDKDLGFKIDPDTGLLKQFISNKITIDFTQQYYASKDLSSFPLDNKTTRQFASFTFEPEYLPKLLTEEVEYKIYQGPIVQELHQKINSYIRNVFRIYANESGIEAQFIIGPVPVNGRGTDIFTKFTTSLSSGGSFYTDSNGRAQIPRHKTKKSSPTETQVANYYPATTLINFKDNDVELGILPDRSQGGTLSKDGELELMLDRRFAFEPENKPPKREDFIEGLLFIILGHTKETYPGEETTKYLLRNMIDWKLFDTWLFVSSTEGLTYQQYKTKHNMAFQGMSRALPTNVKVMTLEPWKNGTILLRLNHLIPTGTDPQIIKPEIIDVKNLFSTFEVISIRETTLGANQWLEENDRLKFRSVTRDTTSTEPEVDGKLNSFTVTLDPMQIRTFIIEVCR